MGSSGGIAAGGAGALTLIESQTLAAAAASVTFSAIPQTYKDLLIVAAARGDAAATEIAITLRVNGDATAAYDKERSLTTTTAVAGEESLATASPEIARAAGGTAPANVFDAAEIVIPEYANTTTRKAAMSRWTCKGQDATGLRRGDTAWWYRTAGAITSVTLLPGSGNFVTGCVFRLYGRS